MKIDNYQLNMLNIEGQKQLQNSQEQSFKQKLKKLQEANSGDDNQEQELKKATQELESLFIHQMLKEMRKTIPKSEYLDTGLQGDIFEDMLDEKYSQEIAASEQFNLSQVLYQQLSKKSY